MGTVKLFAPLFLFFGPPVLRLSKSTTSSSLQEHRTIRQFRKMWPNMFPGIQKERAFILQNLTFLKSYLPVSEQDKRLQRTKEDG